MDYITIPGSSTLNLESGDFTIRWRARYQSHTNTYNMFLSWISGGNYVQIMYKGVDAKYRLITNTWTEGSGQAIDSGLLTPTDNIWYYIVLVRSGNTFSWYINNALSNSVVRTGALTDTSAITLKIGADDTAGREFHGWIDELEIIKGTAITDFSIPTSELQRQANTSLLLNFYGQDGQKAADDSSVNSHALTFVNNAQIDTAQYVYGGSSAAFNVSDFTNSTFAAHRFFNIT